MTRHTPEDLERIARKAREDSRKFEEVRARALAKARGAEYDPDAPDPNGPFEQRVPPEYDQELAALRDRWTSGLVPRRSLMRAP